MNLVQMSLSAGIMIVVVTAIRALAIHRLPKKTFPALWGIVLIRLLAPFSWPSPWSVYSLVSHPDMGHTEAAPIAKILPISPPANVLTESAAEFPPLVWIWGFGVTLCAAFFIIAYCRCRREFRNSHRVENSFTAQWLKEHPSRRRIAIRQTAHVSAPLSYGIFHPVILMPAQTDWADTDRLRYVLTHEYVHIRRFDGAIKFLLTIALCVHWFNPLVWVMFFLANRDIELSCDEKVVKIFGESTKSAYALALISMEERKRTFIPLCNHFSRNAIEERIKAIMKYKKGSVLAIAAAVLLLTGFIVAFATSGATVEPTPSQTNPSGRDTSPDTLKTANSGNIIFNSVELQYYENGWPYLHDRITNQTSKTMVGEQYYMLAYDRDGQPLKLHWNLLDSSDTPAYECLAEVEMKIPSGQTCDVDGGWSLYDEEKMDGWPKIGEGGPNKVAYALYCLNQISFEDGTVWKNPAIETWLETYKGKSVQVGDLQTYYPFNHSIEDKDIDKAP